MEQRALTLRSSAQQDALINGALILLVLGVSLVGAFVVARSMIRSLRRLQDTAQEVAQKRLPDLVKQLSESDPQDVDTSVAEIGINTRDEIGRVARAFDDVHREAVRLAAEQALLRGNVNAMFTNLSRRSQGLIQRQLSLISELESREADPDQLSNLFKLDHLATRMRRNGENLLVLAGEEPGRRWTRPVPLVDVLRAAASEVEQYERIELTSVPPTEVAGRVVNDLVHLLAELLENATSFSSPQTKVRVTGHALPDGRVLIEIHDTGIGLSPEDLADINERLANPPTVDVSVSRRMGLFVVGRLSLRHGIRIQLRPSDSGGTTALVMLPVDLTQGGAKGAPMPQGKRAAPPQGPSGSGVGQAVGRSAQLGAAASQGRGQVSAPGARPALTGNRDSGPVASERAQPRASGLPTRPTRTTPQAPEPAQAAGERPAPSWAQREERGGTDTPRGHDDVRGAESTGQFERPDFHRDGRGAAPGAGEFFTPQRQPSAPQERNQQQPMDAEFTGYADYAGGPGRGDAPTGEFFQSQAPRDPQPTPPQGLRRGGAQGAGYPQDTPTGEFRAPLHAGSGSDVFGPRGRTAPQEDEREATAPAGIPDADRSAGGYQDGASSTGQFPAVGADDTPVRDPLTDPMQDLEQAPSRGAFPRRGGGELPPVSEPMALPPASSPGDGRSPIFESLESDWFRQQAERRDAARGITGTGVPGPGADSFFGGSAGSDSAPASAPASGGGFGGGDLRSAPQRPQARAPQPSGPQRTRPESGGEEWRASPNDERWRRAEQVREPAAGGITPSGLPRRVPRANLVPGTAQSTPQTGPQVSRAPDDVRGRLTNLRRGIQQGRNAGSARTDGPEPDDYRSGTTHQQER